MKNENINVSLFHFTPNHVFSQPSSRNCVIATVLLLRGVGNKKDNHLTMRNHLPGFNIENNYASKISFQISGKKELFGSNEKGLLNPTLSVAKWFWTGETLTNVYTQQLIVDEVLGEPNHLPDDVGERRQTNYSIL